MIEIQTNIEKIYKEVFGIPDIAEDTNFFEIGGNSILAAKVVQKIKTCLGINLAIQDIFEYVTVNLLISYIAKIYNEKTKMEEERYCNEETKEAFELTEIQKAYLIGRQGITGEGKVASHYYVELECETVDILRLEEAWNVVVVRQPALRTIIDVKAMKQKILTRVQDYKIELLDFEEDLKGFYELRRDMEDQVLDISRWPVFDIRVSKLKDKFRIHVSMDNMILDGTAICAVLDEWNKLYKGEVLKSDIGKKTFKDYVNYLKTLELSSEYSMAQEYWNKKIVNMPPRPELPLLNKNVNGEFYRLSTVLQKEKWNVLKMLSAKYGITPSNVLLTSFSEVLYRWGKENKFTINLTINKKALLDSGYAKVLGEFTDTILVEVNAGKKRNFIEKCKSIQNELLNNLKYSSYNGVAVQRDWTKEHGFLMGTAFPIVFTSLLGTADLLDIYDVIERFSLNRETVILGLSNLAFDLSVFDIFGCFQVGGTLVLPDDELKKNPKHILDLIIINRVTVLNAVPAQMKMLDSYMDNAGILEISWVKLIIMSGDWIPVGLPENLFKKFTNAIVVSMGGATECAIWSIFHIIPRGYEKKNSIPYGKPLSNQKFYILNAGMEDCPDGVSGDIYIAGKGLAKEYFKDKEMTDQKFIFLPRIGERIYKTGDVGQYDEAGIIEFLGRSDNQVKVRGHRIELTEIDSILSENKELDDVVSIIVGDAQEDRRIVTVAVPKQAEVATEDTSQEIANIKNKEEELTKEVNKELLSEWVHAANKVVLSDIFLALYGKGVFTDSNRLYTYEEIVKTLNIPNKLYKLMHRWLTVLCNEKIVVHRDGGYCVNLFIAEQYKNNKKLWDEMYSIEGRLHYSQKLLDYLKTSSDVLPELMAGKEDPLNLLFPKGEMDVAMAAYHDNIINRIMNGLAKEEIEFLALDNRRTPIRILEVGAGVGGTSVDVIPSLDGTGAEYYFTDLSAFFLNNAREKFSGYEWVKYNIFDINKDIMEQTIAPFSVDIILAANVLHNAKNIHYVLENLKKLLKPNGTIIILEETLEAYTLLTSMEFKDGLTGFTDERAENNQTFFKREQWEGVFKEHKADIVYQFPEKGTPLEMAGQTIYVVRFKENYICPDKNNMLDELERRIPEYMIPSVITFLPRLPQTSNDKIDRGRISKWISASAEENKKVDVAELPQNDLEEQIARIWCKELNIERIGRNDNFYLSGGDSLLIAQVIARMRETIEAAKRWSWDDLLKEMMKTPTIRGVAKILSNQAGENEQDKSLVIIKEAAESSEKKVTVVFHAGTGTLTPYNSLIAYITERSQENEAVMGFTFGDEAEYLAIPTDKIFENLGKKYGRILSELGFTEYTLIGHCVGGLIALETAHYLKDKGKNVSSVTLLSTSIPHKKEETVLADLDMKIFETAVQTSLYNELLLERTFASLIDADIKKAGHQVDNDTLQQVIEYLIFNNGGNITVQALCSLTGKFAEVGAEFQRLHSMSATERMNDLYTTIERPNGQLMEHQRKMLNVLFRVFAQNFRCVSSYIPKVYTGKMRVFDCESAIANFFPSLFSEDKKTWEQYAQGEFLFDTMKGDHISCMNSPYIEENVKKILDL